MNAEYHPHPDDEDMLRMSDSLPCKADVVSLAEGRADLVVRDHFGGVHVRRNVAVGQSREQDWCVLI